MVDICGIYMIENIVNKKVYIGQSSAINKRFSQHIAELKSNTHTNSHLQAAWNKYCIVDASEKYGVHKSLITMCCRQKIKSCGGRITGVPSVWLYYDEYAKMSKPEAEQYLQARIVTNTENYVREKKSVKCSSGVIYNSIREASKLTGICETSIWKCCNGLRNNAGGFSWEYYFSESVVI